MTVRLTTTVSNIEKAVSNEENVETILRFFEFMKKIGTSERYQNNNLKAIITYTNFVASSIFLNQVNKAQVTSFLDSKIKGFEGNPEKRWITTWNEYLDRMKYEVRSARIVVSEWLSTDVGCYSICQSRQLKKT